MNEEMREEFECLVVSGDLLPDLFVNRICYANRVKMVSDCFNGITYNNDALQLSFEAFSVGWQASREAMKPIKLPKETDTAQCKSMEKEILYDGINYGIKQCKEAIESAGYKVAP